MASSQFLCCINFELDRKHGWRCTSVNTVLDGGSVVFWEGDVVTHSIFTCAIMLTVGQRGGLMVQLCSPVDNLKAFPEQSCVHFLPLYHEVIPQMQILQSWSEGGKAQGDLQNPYSFVVASNIFSQQQYFKKMLPHEYSWCLTFVFWVFLVGEIYLMSDGSW